MTSQNKKGDTLGFTSTFIVADHFDIFKNLLHLRITVKCDTSKIVQTPSLHKRGRMGEGGRTGMGGVGFVMGKWEILKVSLTFAS